MDPEDGEIAIDPMKSVETSEEVIRVVHKVIIDNFNDYIEDEFWSDALFDGKYYLTNQFLSYLELCVDKIDQKLNENLLVFVNFRLLENTVSIVKFKLSIFDGNGKCRFEKVECNKLDEVEKYVWKCEIDRKRLEYDDKMVKTSEVTVWCEIIVTPKSDEKSIFNNQEIENKNILKIDCVEDDKNGIHVVEDILNAQPRIIDSLAHKWSFNDFGYFYRNEWGFYGIVSNKFYSSSNEKRIFHLSLFPNRNKDEFNNNLSIFLYHFSLDNIVGNVRYKISIIDDKGEKFNTRGYQYKFCEKHESFGFREYMNISNLNEVMHNDKIIMFCELQVIGNENGDGNGQIEDNAKKVVEVSESHFKINPQVIDSIAHRWIIENFSCFYQDKWIDSIESNKLYSNSNKKNQFYLGFHPNGDRDEYRNYLSIFLFHSSPDNVDVNVRCQISIIDKKGEKCNTKGLQHIFNKEQDFWGIVNYIYVSQLLDHSNGLLSDDTLTLLCEVQLIGDGKAEDNSSSMVEVFESHFNANPRVIDSLAHKWTIDNFRCFYRDEWSIDEIESDKFFSSSHKEQKFQLSLYPNGDRDEYQNNVSIYLNHLSPDNVDVNVRLEISIIDEKEEKRNIKSTSMVVWKMTDFNTSI